MFKIKTIFEQDVRIFRISDISVVDGAFEALKQFVSEVYSLENFILQYLDEEQDLVTISVGEDLKDAIELAREQNMTLKVFVKLQRSDDDVEMSNTGSNDQSNTTVEPEPEPVQEDKPDQDWHTKFFSDEVFRQDVIGFVQDVITQIRANDTLENAVIIALSAHEELGNIPAVQNILPLLPMISANAQHFLPFIQLLDPQMIPQLVENWVNSYHDESVQLPPFLQHLQQLVTGTNNNPAGFIPPFLGGLFGHPPPPPHHHPPHHHPHPHPHPHHPHPHHSDAKHPHGFQPFGGFHGRKFGCGGRRGGGRCGRRGGSNREFRVEIIANDITLADKAHVLPNQTLVKTWRIKNVGDKDFPEGTSVVYTGPPFNSLVDGASFPVNALKSGEEGDVSITIQIPNEPGLRRSAWRLKTGDGKPFGPILRCRVIIIEDEQNPLTKEERNELKTSRQKQKLILRRDKLEGKLQELQDKIDLITPDVKVDESVDADVIDVQQDPAATTTSPATDPTVNDDSGDTNHVDSGSDRSDYFLVNQDTIYDEQIHSLQNMGFNDVELNLSLLRENDGSLPAVLNILCA